jgi:HEAT repeat protein
MNDSEAGGKGVPPATATVADNRDQIQRHIKDLMSDDYGVRAASVHMLGRFGEEAAEALVDTLLRKPAQTHALANFSDALAEIGKPSVNVILHALNHIVEIRKADDVYLLDSFIELLGTLRDRRVVAPLLEQLRKIDARTRANHDRQLVHCCEQTKVKIHRILAELGERGGLDDLLAMLGDGKRRVRDGVVDALTRVGDRRALVPLVRLYDIEEHVSFSGAQFIKECFREIARREHVTLEDKDFKDLAPSERSILEKILPRSKAVSGGAASH